MFVVRGETAVRCSNCPAISHENAFASSSRDDGFNRNHQPTEQFRARTPIIKIGDCGLLVNRSPDSVPTQFRHHAKAVLSYLAFHFAADMTGPETDSRYL